MKSSLIALLAYTFLFTTAVLGLTLSSKAVVQVYKIDADRDAKFAIKAHPDSKIALRLTSNPSTGYTWFMKSPELLNKDLIKPNNLNSQKSVPFLRDQSTQVLLGSPGYQSFDFDLLKKKGNQVLEFEYKRPWENESAKKFQVKVTVDDQ
jgi:predicted secreted protein